jgi:hypothetical protein
MAVLCSGEIRYSGLLASLGIWSTHPGYSTELDTKPSRDQSWDLDIVLKLCITVVAVLVDEQYQYSEVFCDL